MLKKYIDENGKPHREDGPAIEWDNGKFWYIHGKLHRQDGPACEWSDGPKYWCWEGEQIMETNSPVTEAQIKEFKLRCLN